MAVESKSPLTDEALESFSEELESVLSGKLKDFKDPEFLRHQNFVSERKNLVYLFTLRSQAREILAERRSRRSNRFGFLLHFAPSIWEGVVRLIEGIAGRLRAEGVRRQAIRACGEDGKSGADIA